MSEEGLRALRRMRALGVEWLAVGPEIRMPDIHAPHLERDPAAIAELDRYLERARSEGFRVMLLPRIESPAFFAEPFPFRADIAMTSDTDWRRFFDSYESLLLDYARLARRHDVSILCIGLEYRRCVKQDPGRWRRMISALREVYDGRLTYSANWWKEALEVPFWDALDYVGIGAYYELVANGGPMDAAALDAGWGRVKQELGALARQTGKPILFTETGYPGFADAAAWPWKWQFDRDRPIDVQAQAACFEALFRNLLPEKWFAGLFIWTFYTDLRWTKPWEYSPEGKPAEAVIRRWYRGRGLEGRRGG